MGLLLFGFMVGLLTGIALLFLSTWLVVRGGNKTAAALVLQAAAFALAGRRKANPVEPGEYVEPAPRPQILVGQEAADATGNSDWARSANQRQPARGTGKTR